MTKGQRVPYLVLRQIISCVVRAFFSVQFFLRVTKKTLDSLKQNLLRLKYNYTGPLILPAVGSLGLWHFQPWK